MPRLSADIGLVIPVWYPMDTAPELVDSLLSVTLDGVEKHCRPEQVVLVLDGQECWLAQVQQAANAHDFRMLYLPVNLGKGGAVAAGLEALWQAGETPQYYAIRDSDGDHSIHDLPPLFALAEQIGSESGNPLHFVAGGRPDRNRHIGLERGEFEMISDRLIWQALQYHLSGKGAWPSSVYFAAYGELPDIQTGYKVYSLAAARIAAESLGQVSRTGGGLARYGVETIPAVEILMRGGILGVINRCTMQEQPVSGYARMDVLRLYAEPLIWLFHCLNVPALVAATMLDEAIMRSRLPFDALRREKVMTLRQHVLAELGADDVTAVWGARFY